MQKFTTVNEDLRQAQEKLIYGEPPERVDGQPDQVWMELKRLQLEHRMVQVR